VVDRVRLALGGRGCRSQTFLLKGRNWTEVVVNIAPVFDIIPSFVARRISWLARLVGFRDGSRSIVIFENYWFVCVVSGKCLQ
jgi:hypothetical protein